MMRDVLLRPARHVHATDPVRDRLNRAQRGGRSERVRPRFPWVIAGQQVDEVAYIAPFDDEPPIHERLRRTERRVTDDIVRRALVGETDRDVSETGIGHAMGHAIAIGMDNGELPALDPAGEEMIDQRHARADNASDARIPIVIYIIFPKTALALADPVEAGDRGDARDVFCVLIPQLPLDAEADGRAMRDVERGTVHL